METSPETKALAVISLKSITISDLDLNREGSLLPGVPELVESIKKYGLIQPLVVKEEADGTYLLLAGLRRYMALQSIKAITTTVIVSQKDADVVFLVENLHREDIHPVEIAQRIQSIKTRLNLNNVELGEIIGKKRPTVSGYLSILKLSENILSEARNIAGIKLSTLITLAQYEDKIRISIIWSVIKANPEITVKEIRKLKTSRTPRKKPDAVKQAITSSNSLVHALQEVLTSTSEIDPVDFEILIKNSEQIAKLATQISEEFSLQE